MSKDYFDIIKHYWDKPHAAEPKPAVQQERERILDAVQQILDVYYYKPSCTPANIMWLLYSDLRMTDEEVEAREAKRIGENK